LFPPVTDDKLQELRLLRSYKAASAFWFEPTAPANSAAEIVTAARAERSRPAPITLHARSNMSGITTRSGVSRICQMAIFFHADSAGRPARAWGKAGEERAGCAAAIIASYPH
jgi:hypothetical protein